VGKEEGEKGLSSGGSGLFWRDVDSRWDTQRRERSPTRYLDGGYATT
jgi:hypothetical protein